MMKELANCGSCFGSQLVLDPCKESRKMGNLGVGSIQKELLDEIYIFACVYNIVITYRGWGNLLRYTSDGIFSFFLYDCN